MHVPLLFSSCTLGSMVLFVYTHRNHGNRPFLKFLPTLDAVQECHHLTGGDAFLLKIVLSSVAQLEDLIEKLLPYGNPTTSMVLSTPLERKQDARLLGSL